MILLKRS